MPSEDARELLQNRQTYSFQKIDGFVVLPHDNVVLEDNISVGERVGVFALPDGKYFLSKDPEGLLIENISKAYIFFETTDITVEEK
ncbi:MAG: hypothetical protein V3V88_03625 [Dehalococcoidia bacterium]